MFQCGVSTLSPLALLSVSRTSFISDMQRPTKTNTDDDAIDINVRGRIFTTLRSTLLSQGGMLASMLSESWAQWDPSERIFLNLNPNHFCSMLDDILLAQWGACGDQSVAYFAFLDFLGLLQPVEEKNYLLAGRAYNIITEYEQYQRRSVDRVCGFNNRQNTDLGCQDLVWVFWNL
jgi:hypothetical protein